MSMTKGGIQCLNTICLEVCARSGFEMIIGPRQEKDGKDFLIIHERRLHDDDMTHRLKGSSRTIYLFCETQRPMAEILARFPRFGEDQIRAFLRMMVDKRLMFNEGDRHLSLAVPARTLSKKRKQENRGHVSWIYKFLAQNLWA